MRKDQFELTSGTLEGLSSYQFNKKVITHYFCPDCGVSFVSKGSGVAVNARTVDGIDLEKLKLRGFNGASL
jgi:hypothetical protein